jgi:hypothetical protein
MDGMGRRGILAIGNKLEVVIMEECFNDVAQIDGIASASRVIHQNGGRGGRIEEN